MKYINSNQTYETLHPMTMFSKIRKSIAKYTKHTLMTFVFLGCSCWYDGSEQSIGTGSKRHRNWLLRDSVLLEAV